MAPRAYWKGYLKLSLVSCPIALFPATSSAKRSASTSSTRRPATASATRRSMPIPATRSATPTSSKATRSAKGEYIELDPEELEAVAIESKRTIDIEEFVPRRRDRRTLYPRSLLHRAGRRSRPAGLCRDPRGDPQGRHGGARQGGVHLARAHHRARSARQRHGGHDAALPLRGAQGRRIFRLHRRRENPEGHARPRRPYRRDQGRPFQAGGNSRTNTRTR